MKSQKGNIIVDKSYELALEIIKVYLNLKNQREFELGKQLLKSGTSIGANVQEAQAAQSRKDFIHKLSISLKETKETIYWLRLLLDSNLLSKIDCQHALNLAKEVEKILSSILITSKNS